MLKVIRLNLRDRYNPFSDEGCISEGNRLNFLLDYFEAAGHKDFYPIYTWLLKSYNFQRLDLKDVLDISITFLTGIKKALPELDKLFLKRHRAKIWYLEEWLKLAKGSHSVDKKIERLTVNIKDMWKGKLIKEDPARYLEKLIDTTLEEEE